jgi:hypothetical protein
LRPTSRKKQKPFWERGYKGHVLWLGKAKLGKVRLAGRGHYAWEAAGRAGSADALDKARRAVELAVAMAERQLDLFA